MLFVAAPIRVIFRHRIAITVMLCEKCQQREATIHITSVVCGDAKSTSHLELCAECSKQSSDLSLPQGFKEMIDDISSVNPGFKPEAYGLVQEAYLRYGEAHYGDFSRFFGTGKSSEDIAKAIEAEIDKRGTIPDPTPEQFACGLLEVLRELSLERYGKQAKSVLDSWGIQSCEDFGVVAHRIVGSVMSGADPERCRRAFASGYDFDVAFPET